MRYLLTLLCIKIFIISCKHIPSPPTNLKSPFLNEQNLEYGLKLIDLKKKNPKNKNAIVVIRDESLQFKFKNLVDHFYASNERLETIIWWGLRPHLVNLYDQILYLPYDKVNYENLIDAIDIMEKNKTAYDLIILTHGGKTISNEFTLGSGKKGTYIISNIEIDNLKFSYLNLVYMSGCFSQGLTSSWMKAGAKYVIGFDGLMQNFLFLDSFLVRYHKQGDVVTSFKSSVEGFGVDIYTSLIFTKLLRLQISSLYGNHSEITISDFLKILNYPTLTTFKGENYYIDHQKIKHPLQKLESFIKANNSESFPN